MVAVPGFGCGGFVYVATHIIRSRSLAKAVLLIFDGPGYPSLATLRSRGVLFCAVESYVQRHIEML